MKPYRAVMHGFVVGSVCVSALLSFPQTGMAQSAADSSPTGLVDFARDVFPILRSKCLSCHGPEEAKNDFRVDDPETLLSYVEPGDLESSSLWADYLVTDDPDMKMPPPGAADASPLTTVELAVLRVWIEDGAVWPEGFVPTSDDTSDAPMDSPRDASPTTQDDPTVDSLVGRAWLFSGLFHPAVIHFPIALLIVSAMFVFFSFFNEMSGEPVAYHCLWIATVMAIAACITGWAYAIDEGYGTKVSFDLQGSAIDRHRWLGIAVAIGGLLTFPLARRVRRTRRFGDRLAWLVLSWVLAGGVAIVGYQGGELVYGEDHYWKAFDKWFGAIGDAPTPTPDDSLSEENQEPAGRPEASSSSSPPAPADNASPPSPSTALEGTAPAEEQRSNSGESAAADEDAPVTSTAGEDAADERS